MEPLFYFICKKKKIRKIDIFTQTSFLTKTISLIRCISTCFNMNNCIYLKFSPNICIEILYTFSVIFKIFPQ